MIQTTHNIIMLNIINGFSNPFGGDNAALKNKHAGANEHLKYIHLLNYTCIVCVYALAFCLM